MRNALPTALAALTLAWSLAGCETPLDPITRLENRIRANPQDSEAPTIRERILSEASRGQPWDEVNRYLAQFDDIEGARYDEENNRLVVWGPEAKGSGGGTMPPLLVDDFVVIQPVVRQFYFTREDACLFLTEYLAGKVGDPDIPSCFHDHQRLYYLVSHLV